MRQLRILLTACLVLMCNWYSNAQSCEDRAQIIYQNLLNSIGNDYMFAPDLYILDSQNKVAYINNEGIFIERKLLDLFCEEEHFEASIAYVLAHEVAHFFLEHNWMKNSGLGYSNEIGEFLDEKAYDKEQRKLAESQADLFGGFYGQVAGYNTLAHAEKTLAKIYEKYGIPKVIKGYPSLEERYQIIQSNKEKAENLRYLFDLGNVLLMSGHYAQAKDCFEIILKNKFTSREIYNNLGVSYLSYAISQLEKPYSSLFYPIYLDRQTRLETGATRSSGFLGSPKQLFEKSKKYFDLALKLDPDYLPGKQNLKVYEFHQLLLDGTDREAFIEGLEKSGLNEKTIQDFVILDRIIRKKEIRKKEKLALKGSEVSRYNLGLATAPEKTASDRFETLLEEAGIAEEEYVFGFERPYSNHRFEYAKYRLRYKAFEKGTLFDLNNSIYLFKQQEAKPTVEGIFYKGAFYTVVEKE